MARRKHKKSRLGCLECKRRRIKCDERRPICSQCTISERTCGFAEPYTLSFRPAIPRKQTPSISVSSAEEASPTSFTSVESPDEPPVNMLHAELLCHLFTETLPSVCDNSSHQMMWSSPEILQCCFKVPYLANELLALAATHISIIRPAQRELYRDHATQLQIHALRTFYSAADPDITPRFLFSSILSLHTLCVTLLFRDTNFDVFLDSFVHYLRLHRGVRTVLGGRWRTLKETTALGPVLGAAESQLQSEGSLDPACSRLLTLVQQAKLGPSVTATYQDAIEGLQLAMTSAASPGAWDDCTPAVLAWPASVPLEYIDLLARRSPDALAVLAHYGTVLHAHRHCWFLGDGGRYLIESIRESLGPEWAEWMAFPGQTLESIVTLDPLDGAVTGQDEGYTGLGACAR
ncbi:hypothetical protein BO82DRAFT_283253 [Aspergillus uvarum CBS 121591]|uniref:Zn(2)-C6 fungal-type domain-containing protein n=1 Tax=Aspergillus uvarum CBS 121591 TaxID=1448315 RepID=A0A319CBX5_9EURO|nr:hypothetical protein BO82DRAFT_283253 [Aspergillus uvarum CBS 121591]PYH81810.1 hypothetical protein BO82DRAFT_283253 [Aspergillus uvarum CBS 121591]